MILPIGCASVLASGALSGLLALATVALAQAVPAPGQVAAPAPDATPVVPAPTPVHQNGDSPAAGAVADRSVGRGAPRAGVEAGDNALGPVATTTLLAIDRPEHGATTSQRFTLQGWAVDPENPGSGVDAVHVYLDGEAGRGPFVGAATYGEERLDVAQQLGQPRFGLSGFSIHVEVAPGAHTLYIYARQRGSVEPRAWSAPAAIEIVALAESVVPAAARVVIPPGGCARGADGACINRLAMPAPTCPQIGPEGQCLPAAPGAVPGVVGAPSAGPGTPNGGFCTQLDGSGQCLRYTGASAVSSPSITLRAEASGSMTLLSWAGVSGAITYELLRCGSVSAPTCASVAVVSGTSYQTPRSASSWYRVEARTQSGQVIATSNIVGPV